MQRYTKNKLTTKDYTYIYIEFFYTSFLISEEALNRPFACRNKRNSFRYTLFFAPATVVLYPKKKPQLFLSYGFFLSFYLRL
ncbi:hypothetical protein HMPREF9151_02336 [Hoylesella saccharolytica F0055]|uniref:Uncharacterized protein n=1 Tax=Hoylesella saccharolytica F0055 TaxID=1127699 RepID=L1N015_9BACT|nr:hypothetical protein HMPREF9151_02336 [Hoylesella saccharolytica F0055]